MSYTERIINLLEKYEKDSPILEGIRLNTESQEF